MLKLNNKNKIVIFEYIMKHKMTYILEPISSTIEMPIY